MTAVVVIKSKAKELKLYCMADLSLYPSAVDPLTATGMSKRVILSASLFLDVGLNKYL